MKLTKLVLSLVTVCSISACSNLSANLPSNDELLQELTQQNGRECVRDGDISGFGVLDDDVVSVGSRRRGEYFLMTTLYRCYSLDISVQMAFLGSFAEFCGGGSDKISTGEESCPIKSIYKFESRDKAFEAFDEISMKKEQLRKELTEKK